MRDRRRRYHRSMLPPILMAALIVAVHVGIPATAGLVPRSAGQPVGNSSIPEERPSGEERPGSDEPASSDRWRSPQESASQSAHRRHVDIAPRGRLEILPKIAATGFLNTDVAAETGFDVLPDFHHWVRSQTW